MKDYTQSRSPEALGRTVITWLYIYLASTVLAALAIVVELGDLGKLPGETPMDLVGTSVGSASIQLFAMLIRLVELAAFIVSGVLTLKWIYRVNMNAHVLRKGLTISPPWAVGYYFIPFANLVMPFQAMRETWQVSAHPDAPYTQKTPALLRWWWGLWLVTGVTGNISAQLSFRGNDVAMMIASDIFELLSAVLAVPLIVIVIRMVRELSRLQVDALHGHAFD